MQNTSAARPPRIGSANRPPRRRPAGSENAPAVARSRNQRAGPSNVVRRRRRIAVSTSDSRAELAMVIPLAH